MDVKSERQIPSDSQPAMWRRAWFQFALVAVVAGSIAFYRLSAETLEEHETYAALAAKNMYDPGYQAGGWRIVEPPSAKTVVAKVRAGEAPPPTAQKPLPPDTLANRWLIPLNNGKPRLEKTPLPYWVMAGVAKLAGHFDSWTARATSALSMVLVALVTLGLGRRIVGPRAALIGALMLATTLGMQKFGRSARPELILCLMCTAAMACFHLGITASTRRARTGWMIAFWLAMGLANLCKQFYPLLLLLPLLVYLFWQQSERDGQGAAAPRRRHSPTTLLAIYCIAAFTGIVLSGFVKLLFTSEILKYGIMLLFLAGPLVWYFAVTRGYKPLLPLLPTAIPGLAVMLAMFLPWMYHMVQLFGHAGEIFNEQIAARAAGGGDWGKSPPWYYIVPLITLTLPWVGFLPGAWAMTWMKRFSDRRKGLMFLFLWALLLIAMLTLSTGKREHYLLPMFPAICLLMGFAAEDAFFVHRWVTPKMAKALGLGYAIVALVAPAIVLFIWRSFNDGDEKWSHIFHVTFVIAALGAAMTVLCLLRRFAPALALLFASIVIVYLGYERKLELWDIRIPIVEFAQEAARIAGPTSPVISWDEPQMKTVYSFGRDICNANWKRDDLDAQYGQDVGERKFLDWVRAPQSAAYIFAYEGASSRELEAMGFQVVLRKFTLKDTKPVFRKGRLQLQEIPLVFLLMRNGQLPPASSTRAGSEPATLGSE